MSGSEIMNQLLEFLHLRAGTFARKIGYPRPQKIYDIQKGKTKYISNDVANDIVAAFPNINKSWLLSGEGSMVKETINGSTDVVYMGTRDKENVFFRTTSGIDYFELENGKYRMRVPLVPYNAYARYANEPAEAIAQERDDCDKVEFIVDQIYHGYYVAFEIKGDSMDDNSKHSISHGDVVLARRLDPIYWKDGLRYEKFPFWIVVLDSTILCKQIVGQNMETGDITCHSLNPSPEYKDFTVNLNDVRQLFNIVQKMSSYI